jgi:hypothetical protein
MRKDAPGEGRIGRCGDDIIGSTASPSARPLVSIMAQPADLAVALYQRNRQAPSAESIIGNGVAESVLLDAAILLSSYDFANILPDTAPAVMLELCRLLALKTQARDVFGAVIVCEPGSDVDAAWLEVRAATATRYMYSTVTSCSEGALSPRCYAT